MGKTNPTYRQQVEGLEERWSSYRRGLRRQDKQPFDELWKHAKNNADAAGYMNPENPIDTVFLSILLEQEKRINTLEKRLLEIKENQKE